MTKSFTVQDPSGTQVATVTFNAANVRFNGPTAIILASDTQKPFALFQVAQGGKLVEK